MIIGSKPTTWVLFAQRIGAEFGLDLTDDEADWALWEHTGFPGFYHGDAKTYFAGQLRLFFREVADR